MIFLIISIISPILRQITDNCPVFADSTFPKKNYLVYFLYLFRRIDRHQSNAHAHPATQSPHFFRPEIPTFRPRHRLRRSFPVFVQRLPVTKCSCRFASSFAPDTCGHRKTRGNEPVGKTGTDAQTDFIMTHCAVVFSQHPEVTGAAAFSVPASLPNHPKAAVVEPSIPSESAPCDGAGAPDRRFLCSGAPYSP